MGPHAFGARLRFALLCAALVSAFGLSVLVLAWQFNLLRASTAHTALFAAAASAAPLLAALPQGLLP